jgi:hypothetical protein
MQSNQYFVYFASACNESKSIAAMPQLLLEMNEKSCDCRPSVVAVHGDLTARSGCHFKSLIFWQIGDG